MKHISLGLALVFVLVVNVLPAKGEGLVIENGKKVKFDYTLTVKEDVVDTSKGKAPLEYTQGAGQIIPASRSRWKG